MEPFEFARHMSSTGGEEIFGSHKKKKPKDSDTRVRSIRKRRKKPPKPIQVPCEFNVDSQPSSHRSAVETPANNKRRRSRKINQYKKRQSSGSDEFGFLDNRNGSNNRVLSASKEVLAYRYDKDEHDSNEMEELEIPYALNNGQNANSSDDSDGGYCSPSSRKRKKRTEPLRPGDLIEYTCPIFVAGSRQGRRTAIVLSTDPSQKKYPIVLNNAELLSRDVHIKRIGEYLNGDLHQHDGVFRSINMFLMTRRKLPGHDLGIAAGLKHRAKKLTEISKQIQEDAWKAVKSETGSTANIPPKSTRDAGNYEETTKKSTASNCFLLLSSSSSDSSPVLQRVQSSKTNGATTSNASKDDTKTRSSLSTSNGSSSDTNDDNSEDCLIPLRVRHNTKICDDPKSVRSKKAAKRRVILSSSINSDSETSSSGSDSELFEANSIQQLPTKERGDLRRETTSLLSKRKKKPNAPKTMPGVLGLRKENSISSSLASTEEQEIPAVTRHATNTNALGLCKQRNTVPSTVASTEGNKIPTQARPSPATSVLGLRKQNVRPNGSREPSPFATTNSNLSSVNRAKKRSPRSAQGTGFQPLQLSLVTHSTPVSVKSKNKKQHGSRSKSKKRIADTRAVNLVDS